MPLRGEATPAPLWLPELDRTGAERVLDADDAHYVTRVCRVGPGERFEATDGAGTRATLTLLSNRGEVRAVVDALAREPRPPRVQVACGAPEKDRADWMIEKLAELGVTDFQPLECERSGWERWSSRRDRLERLARAALRQSRGAWKLEIREPMGIDAWLAGPELPAERWLADPGGGAWESSSASAGAVAAIGPSPGFSDSERDRLVAKGFRPLRLAALRIRTETAAVAWASLRAAAGSAADRA